VAKRGEGRGRVRLSVGVVGHVLGHVLRHVARRRRAVFDALVHLVSFNSTFPHKGTLKEVGMNHFV